MNKNDLAAFGLKKIPVNPHGLDDQRAEFCRHYALCNDPVKAAIKAGYPPTMASIKSYAWINPSKSPEMVAYITELQAMRKEELKKLTHNTEAKLMAMAFDLAEKAIAAEKFGDGAKMLETLFKAHGMLTEKREITHKNPFASGNDPVAIERDFKHIVEVSKAAYGNGEAIVDNVVPFPEVKSADSGSLR